MMYRAKICLNKQRKCIKTVLPFVPHKGLILEIDETKADDPKGIRRYTLLKVKCVHYCQNPPDHNPFDLVVFGKAAWDSQ